MNPLLKRILNEMNITLPVSVLHQAHRDKLLTTVKISARETLKVTVCYYDSCKKGHNDFTITAGLYDSRRRREGGLVAGGCLHDEIKQYCPELGHLIKWHLVGTDGPIHYLENSRFWAEHVAGISEWKDSRSIEEKLEIFRSTAVWPEATIQDAIDASTCYGAETLVKRLPALMVEFKQTIESLGFEY